MTSLGTHRHTRVTHVTLGHALWSSTTMSVDVEIELTASEKWWRERYQFLESRGYRLRERYRPGWVPSWQGTGRSKGQFEDGWFSFVRGFFQHL